MLQVEGFITSLEYVPDKITEELLTIEIDCDEFSSPTSTTASKRFSIIWQSILEKFTLSDEGKRQIQNLIQTYSVNNKQDEVLKFYAANCLIATSFFDETTPEEANVNFLDIVKLLCNYNAEETNAEVSNQAASISSFEEEAIEYLGGFVLYKASLKFPFSSAVIKFMTQLVPKGKLIKAIEQNDGSLFYPNDKFVSLLHTVYFKCSRETMKPANEINFNQIFSTIHHHNHYQSYLESILNEDHNVEEQLLCKLMEFIVKLFVKVLSYTAAKRIFQNICHSSTTRQTKSFRQAMQSGNSSFSGN